MDIHLSTIDHVRQQVIDLLIQFGPRLLTAILIVIAGVIVGGWAERWLLRRCAALTWSRRCGSCSQG